MAWGESAAAAPPSAEEQTRIDPVFGNTVVSTYANGDKAKLWIERDGTYSGEGRKGNVSTGHWTLKADKICMRQSTPIPVPFSFCTPLPDVPAGVSWTAKAVTGDTIQVKVVKGNGG